MKLTRMIGFLLFAISPNPLMLAQQAVVRTSSGVCSTELPNANQLALVVRKNLVQSTKCPGFGANGQNFS